MTRFKEFEQQIQKFLKEAPKNSLDRFDIANDVARSAIGGSKAAYALLMACVGAWDWTPSDEAYLNSMQKIAARKCDQAPPPQLSTAEKTNRKGHSLLKRGDFEGAWARFEDAFQQECADAKSNQGYMLQRGLGRGHDGQAARSFYHDAFVQGSLAGGFNLAVTLLFGVGGPKDLQRAEEILYTLAKENDTWPKRRWRIWR